MTRSWTLALLLNLIAPASRKVSHPGDSVLAFVGVAVIPMDRERVLENQTVLIQGKSIMALGPTGQTPIPANAVQVDGRGKYLLPGLADMHTHLWGGGDSLRTERALSLFAASGVTTIRNMDYFGAGPVAEQTAPLLRWRARVAAGELWAPRIYTAGVWYTDSTQSVDDNIAIYKAAGYDFIKVHDEGLDSQGRLDSLVAAAHRVGLPIAGHAAGGLSYALEHRFKSIEHLHGFPRAVALDARDTLQTPALITATRQAGVWICPTDIVMQNDFFLDAVSYRRSLPSEWRDREEGKLRRRLIKALQDAGVGLLLGTDADAGGEVPGVSAHHELQLLVWAGLTPYQALLTGTRNVATYFGTEDSTGTIAVGKRADLVLLHGNPLADIRNSSNIAGVMIVGRWRPQVEIERQMEGYAQANDSIRAWFKWP